MTTTIDRPEIEAAVRNGIRGFHKSLGHIEFGDSVDPFLLDLITSNITALLDRKVEEAIAEARCEVVPPVTSIGELSTMSDRDVRAHAYNVASRIVPKSWNQDQVHGEAEKIARNIEDGFPSKTEVLSVTIKPDMTEFQEMIDSIFGRTEWRREGWNDLKAKLLRTLNKEINSPDIDSFVLHPLGLSSLKVVRDFIAKFNFDPTKP